MNGQKENLRKKGRRLLTAFLALALAMTYFPADMLTAQAEETAAQTEAAAVPEEETETIPAEDGTEMPPAEEDEFPSAESEETVPEKEEPESAPEEGQDTVPAESEETVSSENNSVVPEEGQEAVSEENSGMTPPTEEEPDSVLEESAGIIPAEEALPAPAAVNNEITALAETGEDTAVDTILETDGGEVTWDFTEENAPIYTEHKDGSLSVSGGVSHNTGGHGMMLVDGAKLSIEIPAGQTSLKLGICQYSNDSLTATIKVKEELIQDGLSLTGTDDKQELFIEYSTDAATILTIEMSGSGQAYLHYITAETVTPPQLAAVSGTVSPEAGTLSAAGQTLVFTDTVDSTKMYSAVLGDNGEYNITLPIGNVYMVSFEQSDVFEVAAGGTLDLTDVPEGGSVSNPITYRVVWDISKIFAFTIADTTYTVTPGSSSAEDFSVTAEGGAGSAELATADTAIIWADLGGAGTGALTADMLENVSDSVEYTLSGNTVAFRYKDNSTAPAAYTVQVKDNSASGQPHADGATHTYDFRDGSVVSELYTGNYAVDGGASVRSEDGLLTLSSSDGGKIQFNDAAHGIAVSNGTQIQVKVAGDAKIVLELCQYTAGDGMLTAAVEGDSGSLNPNQIDAGVSADGDKASVQHTGDGATITFTYTGGTGYLHEMSVTNELPEPEVTVQESMPEILDYGTKGSMTVSAVGQRLILSQEDGSLATNSALSDNVGYYGFGLTSDMNRLEADVTVNSCGNSSSNGVFFGAFDGEAIETVGIRNSTNLRGIYTREDNAVGAGRISETITAGQTVHFTAERTADGFVITATPEGGETYTVTSSKSDALVSGGGAVSFGFILANASVTVTNMRYCDAEEKTLYDQNECYEAIGAAPSASNVRAAAAATRDAINVMWNTDDLPYGDAHYVIQVSKDNGNWETIGESQSTSFLYPTTESGIYKFRVGGAVGSGGTVQDGYAESAALNYLAALPSPVLTVASAADASSIQLAWTPSEGAVSYELYKYSSDQGAEGAVLLATVSETSYTDTAVELEVPYYYYVIAKSAGNSSNPSETVWTVVSAGHTGDYAYEDEAAVITITGCPNSTIFQSAVTISGTVDRAGMMRAFVNDASLTTAAAEQQVTAGGNFTLNLQLAQGRNDVRLIFTDENGTETCLTYNFVYLNSSEINMIVDASYEGEDGANVDGIPAYSTVQAAVNAAAQNASVQRSAERTVIFIKNGDYEERLVVSVPNISLIGESEEGVRIHCYPANLHPDDSGYEAGGDMNLRCATYITSDAAGFSAENMTFANDYEYGTNDGKTNKSADALRCDADGASFVNVTFSGVQDTLYIGDGNVYFYKCRIEGLIDFIYSGDTAKALFEDCEIVFVYEETHPEGGYVCAPRTEANSGNGLFFYDCSVTSEPGCEEGTFHLARPWGPDAAIYWINCYLGSAINADEPYADMSGNSFMEANFYEYGSYGLGYKVNEYRKQISPSEAKELLEIAVSALGAAYIGNISNDIAAGKLEPQHPETDVPSDVPEGGNEGENTGDTGNAGDTGNGGQTGDNVNTGDTGSNGQTGNSSNSGNSGHTGSGSSSGTSGSGSDSSSAAQSAVVQNTVTSTTSASATTVTSAADDADTDVETVEGTPDDYALEEVEEETENAAEGEESTAVIDEEETPLGSQQIRGLRSILPWLIIPVALIIAGIFGWNVYKRKNESED